MGGGVRSGGPAAITSSTNVLSGEPFACSGLGAAFISGYYAGINAGNCLKNLQCAFLTGFRSEAAYPRTTAPAGKEVYSEKCS